MDLPVPVVGGVHLLPQRRAVEDEVVGRAVEARPRAAEHLAERLGGRDDVAVVGAREVRVVAARDHPHLERRAARVRRERDRVIVRVEQAVRAAHLVAHEAAVRALALADQEARRAAQLLGDPVRDLRQVVQVEAQVVGAGAGLRAPVLEDLEVRGGTRPPRGHDLVAGAREELLDRACCPPRGADGAPPAARRPSATSRRRGRRRA